MTLLQALILGAFQGIAEFLPISSSGHLVLLRDWMGLSEIPALFDIILHVATLGSIVVVFRQRLASILSTLWHALGRLFRRSAATQGGEQSVGETEAENRALLWPAIIATLITAVLGFLVKRMDLNAGPRFVGFCLLLTACFLVCSQRLGGKTGYRGLRWWHGALVGLAQGLGVLPGISRSGSTISAGLAAGMDRQTAGEFSFLLAIPAILGALILDLGDIPGLLGSISLLPLLAGSLAAFLVGIAALRLLMPLVRRGRLAWFALYLLPLGIISIILG